MKKISTTALAKELGMESSVLFQNLSKKKWIYKKDGKWKLTKEGRIAGGSTQFNPSYGEYVVWPVDLDLDKKVDLKSTIGAKQIAEHFNLSAQKINLYFSELGWIEKDQGGWILTNLGEKNGAVQLEAPNGKPYVAWRESILENRHLKREIKGATGDESYQDEEEKIENADDFRKKFPAKLRTPDGHYVRSRAELLIDDFLYKNGIVHAYERKLNIDEDMYCDFYIPSDKLYIEFWGMEENANYLERKKKKIELYNKYRFKLIELNDLDIENLEEKFAEKLRKFNIVVD